METTPPVDTRTNARKVAVLTLVFLFWSLPRAAVQVFWVLNRAILRASQVVLVIAVVLILWGIAMRHIGAM
jgi:hypothetical protein